MWQQNKLIIVLAIIVGVGYGGRLLYRYSNIRRDSAKRAAYVVVPRREDDDVVEVGYVYSMRDEVFLRDDNRINLIWFVKVPASGARYSCAYERGFPEFRKGDDVMLIRPKEADYGYMVGLHGKLTGKAALVYVVDEEELEMNAPEPDLPD